MVDGYFSKEVVPLLAMITVEFTNVGINIIFKAATLAGMSYYVFIVYSYAFAALILLPLSLISFSRVTAQVLAFAGINYSSPTLASAVGNLTPAFTFTFALIFRLERVTARSSVSQAKILGTLVSITGAFVVVFYKGPAVVSTSSSHSSLVLPQEFPHTQRIIGGTLLATEYLLVVIMYVVQSSWSCCSIDTICSMFISIPVCINREPNLRAWKLGPNLGLAAILYSGLFGSGFSSVVHTWGLRIKGPVYISIFRPLSIIIAAGMGFIFLGDNLYQGWCVIGAVIISTFFYAVMWGKARELREDEAKFALQPGLPKHTVPLLTERFIDYLRNLNKPVDEAKYSSHLCVVM